MKNKKQETIVGFFAVNFIITLLLGTQYFRNVGWNSVEMFFAVISLLSHFLSLYILLFFAIFIFNFVSTKEFLSDFLTIAVMVLFNCLIFIDVAIFRIFRFHINGLVLNLILTKGGWESLDFTKSTEAYLIIIAVALVLMQVTIYYYIKHFVHKRNVIIKKSFVYIFFFLFGLILLSDKFMYAYGDLYNITQITRHSKLYPLYQPLTIKKFAQKHLKLNNAETRSIHLKTKDSALSYPKQQLRYEKQTADFPNILIILIDSFRYDMFARDITPNIIKFSRDSMVFENHYSGGNCTRFGVFSIFYGLHGFYWNAILGERRSPILMDAMKNFGYEFKIFSATKLTFPEFTKTCFVNVDGKDIYDDPAAESKPEKDLEITERLIDYIEKPSPRAPFFAFMFLDCPHGSYGFPPEYEKFRPTVPEFNYLLLNKDNIQPVFNRYKNAIHYNDFLVGKIIESLKKTKILDNTVVIISGDHGEAFFEKGFYGHNRGFCMEQVKVPMIMRLPSKNPGRYSKLTSHADIVPTLLPMFGCVNDAADYSHGVSLTGAEEHRFAIVSSWDEMAMIYDGHTVVFPTESYKLSSLKIYDSDYKEIRNNSISEQFTPYLLKFQKELSYYLK